MLQGFPFASSSSMTLQGTSLSEILAFVHNGFFGNEFDFFKKILHEVLFVLVTEFSDHSLKIFASEFFAHLTSAPTLVPAKLCPLARVKDKACHPGIKASLF